MGQKILKKFFLQFQIDMFGNSEYIDLETPSGDTNFVQISSHQIQLSGSNPIFKKNI
jgi:hypothetical protein